VADEVVVPILFVTLLLDNVEVEEIEGIATPPIVGAVKDGAFKSALSALRLAKFVLMTSLDAEIKSPELIVVIVLIYLSVGYACPFTCNTIPPKTYCKFR
jgi:hypothetical protein